MSGGQELVQYTVTVRNAPGQLHRIMETLAAHGINLLGLSSDAIGPIGNVRFIAEQEAQVRQALAEIGEEALESRVCSVLVPNRAGAAARVTQALRDEGLNIASLYVTAGDGGRCRVVVTCDEPMKARAVLAQMQA